MERPLSHSSLSALLVKYLEVNPEGQDHDDGQPTGGDTNTARVSVSLTPDLEPDVRAGDVTQLTERIDESNGHSSLRGRTGERGTNPRKEYDRRGFTSE